MQTNVIQGETPFKLVVEIWARESKNQYRLMQ
jgi:hypothetical protein